MQRYPQRRPGLCGTSRHHRSDVTYLCSRPPERVDVLGILHAPTSEDSGGILGADELIEGGIPYDDEVFVKAARWLLEQPGIDRLTVLTRDPPGYVPVDSARLE